jgi:pimeloyl-ACP methyl ester carboxylesterase
VAGDHANDLLALIKELGSGPAHLVGSSYGAYVTLLATVQEPSEVRSLTLGEPPIMPLLQHNAEGSALASAFNSNVIAPSRQAFAAGRLDEGVRVFIDGVMGKAGSFDHLPAAVRDRFLRCAPSLRQEFFTDTALYMPPVLPEELQKIRVPTLLMNGEESPRFFHVITDELERWIPDCVRTMIPQSGHSMHRANPSSYDRVVGEFLLKH